LATNFFTSVQTIDYDPLVSYFGWVVSTSGDLIEAHHFPSAAARDAFPLKVKELLGEEACKKLVSRFPGSELDWKIEKFCALLLCNFCGEDVSELLENNAIAAATAMCEAFDEEYESDWDNVINDLASLPADATAEIIAQWVKGREETESAEA